MAVFQRPGWRPAICLIGLFVAVPVDWRPCDGEDKVPDRITQAFSKADRNNDRVLTFDEFQVDRIPLFARRDFQLFDHNRDEKLTLQEFWSIPQLIQTEPRGAIPDPLQSIVDQVAAALDQSLGNWNERPGLQQDAGLFATAFTQRFKNYGIAFQATDADQDGNGMLSRAEARLFLEHQFGLCRLDGKRLHLSDGRVVNYMLYLHVDVNSNDQIERSEFLERSYGDPLHVGQEFDAANVDGDKVLSFEEWCRVPGRAVSDPIQEFLQLDTNVDAALDPDEFLAGTPAWKGPLRTSTFPAFDLNKDGKLSLTEYRLSMTANMVLKWQSILLDQNGDGHLTFDEFAFECTLFPLLRILYFHRLDADSSNSLEPNEFSFKFRSPDEFFIMNSDGSEWRSFFRFPGHNICNSPAVSPDGKSIAFDARKDPQRGETILHVMSIDGGNPEQIETGMLPSWSKDGKTLACSRGGACLIDLQKKNARLISRGWGAQYSPDGMRIAYTESGSLKVMDLNDESVKTILGGDENPFRQIFWNAAWSPDGKRICFKATKDDDIQEIASVNTTGDKPQLKIHYSGKVMVDSDIAWHPTQSRVIFSRLCPERSVMQLYEFNPLEDRDPILMEGQDPARNNTDMCWTPDGARLIVISGDF